MDLNYQELTVQILIALMVMVYYWWSTIDGFGLTRDDSTNFDSGDVDDPLLDGQPLTVHSWLSTMNCQLVDLNCQELNVQILIAQMVMAYYW